MGWSKWVKHFGDLVSSKSVNNSDGSSSTHYLRAKGGNRSNHNHVVVNKNSSGRISSAHGNTYKKDRK